MGILDRFKESNLKKESEMIDWLYGKADELTQAQLTQLLRYIFKFYGSEKKSNFMLSFLVKEINRHIECAFLPREAKDFNFWLDSVFCKVNHEKQKAIFVTACFNIWKTSAFSSAAVMAEIDKILAECRQMLDFVNAGKGES